jgi:hypothetical protein
MVRSFLYYWRRSYWFLCLCETDVHDALASNNDNRCNSDISLSVTFRFTPQHVRDSFYSNRLRAHCSLCHRSANDYESGNPSWQRSSRLVSTNKDTAVVHIPSDRLEVSVHTTYEEHPMSHLADKPHELGFEDSVEDREGNKRVRSSP